MSTCTRLAACAIAAAAIWLFAVVATGDAQGPKNPQSAKHRGRLPNPQIGVLIDFIDPADARAFDHYRHWGRNHGGPGGRGRGRGGPTHGPAPEDQTHLDGHYELIGGVWADSTPGDGVVDPNLVFYVDTYGYPSGVEEAVQNAFEAWEEVTAGSLFADIQFTYYDDAAGVFGDGINTISMWDLDPGILAATFIIWDDVDNNGDIDAGEQFLEMDMIHNAQIVWGTNQFRPLGRRQSQSWYDLQAITTHEVGHVIGLDHPGDAHRRDYYQTMYATANARETMKRTLEFDGDIPGAQSDFLGYGAP